MPFAYSAYGFRLKSNHSILGLVESEPSEASDIEVWIGQGPPWIYEPIRASEQLFYVSPALEREIPIFTIWKSSVGAYFRLVYSDGTEFFVDTQGARISVTWQHPLTLADATVYLRGQVMGFVLRLRGITCLHASAVVVDHQAIAVMGGAGAGKSTTAASFARLGYPVLSDDILPLVEEDGVFRAQPGCACLCLWPESVNNLFGAPDALPLLTPTWDKRYLALGGGVHQFQHGAVRLAAIYFLENRGGGPTFPIVQEMTAEAAFLALIANTYMNYLLDSEMRTREFRDLGKLLASTPLKTVRPHEDPERLTRLCEVIVEDFRSQASAEGRVHH